MSNSAMVRVRPIADVDGPYPSSNVVTPNNRCMGTSGARPVYIRAVSNTIVIRCLSASATAAGFVSGTSR